MTQQYVVGEFSILVAELEPAAGELGGSVHALRREIELSPFSRLPRLAREAFDLTDRICLGALEAGDVASFRRGATTAAALWDFSAGARLLA